jgi:hypothetical protein
MRVLIKQLLSTFYEMQSEIASEHEGKKISKDVANYILIEFQHEIQNLNFWSRTCAVRSIHIRSRNCITTTFQFTNLITPYFITASSSSQLAISWIQSERMQTSSTESVGGEIIENKSEISTLNRHFSNNIRRREIHIA